MADINGWQGWRVALAQGAHMVIGFQLLDGVFERSHLPAQLVIIGYPAVLGRAQQLRTGEAKRPRPLLVAVGARVHVGGALAAPTPPAGTCTKMVGALEE